MSNKIKILWAENEAFRTELESQNFLEYHDSYDVDIELRCDLAWRRLIRNEGKYHLAIIDIRMPVGDNLDWANGKISNNEKRAGEILALRIRQVFPNIELAILTNENRDVLDRVDKELDLDMDKAYMHKKDLNDPEDIEILIKRVLS